MTPCEKLGYKVGDEFFYKPESKSAIVFERGAKLKLKYDDGSSNPAFETIDGSKSWDDDVWAFARIDNVKPINKQEQPMPQQHLADQLEAALASLEHAQSEVDRLQSEYRAAYPKIHGEVVLSKDIPGWRDWRAGDIVEVVDIEERDPVSVGDIVTIDEDGDSVPYCITRNGKRHAFKHAQLRFVRRP